MASSARSDVPNLGNDDSVIQVEQCDSNLQHIHHGNEGSRHTNPLKVPLLPSSNCSESSGTSSVQECRICGDDETAGRLISPCDCTGSISRVHASCLEKWITQRPTSSDVLTCEICHSRYGVSIVNRLKCDIAHICSSAALSHMAEGIILSASVLLMFFILFYLSPRLTKDNKAESGILVALFALSCAMSMLALRKVYQRWHNATSIPVIE